MQANKIDWISQLEINIYTTRLASIDQYFHDTVPLLVGPLHPTSDIFIVIYIFVYVLTCTTEYNGLTEIIREMSELKSILPFVCWSPFFSVECI